MICRVCLVVALVIALVAPASAQSSAHFSMKRIAAVSGSATMMSTNFNTGVVGPQESPSGGASFCNFGNEVGLGFWSVLEDISVPIVLTGHRSQVDPLHVVDLSWSGDEPAYQLYRAYTPSDVFNPANLDRETAQCAANDELASQSNIIFYSVIKKP
jgi:hypothetical protein